MALRLSTVAHPPPGFSKSRSSACCDWPMATAACPSVGSDCTAAVVAVRPVMPVRPVRPASAHTSAASSSLKKQSMRWPAAFAPVLRGVAVDKKSRKPGALVRTQDDAEVVAAVLVARHGARPRAAVRELDAGRLPIGLTHDARRRADVVRPSANPRVAHRGRAQHCGADYGGAPTLCHDGRATNGGCGAPTFGLRP